MQITVVECDWGGSRTTDIGALLADVACHLFRPFRILPTGSILVEATNCPDDSPKVLFRSSTRDPFRIQLSARGTHWSQFAFQFSHELCHVLSDYERLRVSQNRWFHESLCELASIFTIRRMAEIWPVRPPFPNWAGYANSLTSYAADRVAIAKRQVPAGVALSTWIQSEEESLRANCIQRHKNLAVAYSLLPIFEREPAVWNAIRRLPESSAMFKEYLLEWFESVEPTDKPMLSLVLDALNLPDYALSPKAVDALIRAAE